MEDLSISSYKDCLSFTVPASGLSTGAVAGISVTAAAAVLLLVIVAGKVYYSKQKGIRNGECHVQLIYLTGNVRFIVCK